MGRELWSISTTCQDIIHYFTAPKSQHISRVLYTSPAIVRFSSKPVSLIYLLFELNAYGMWQAGGSAAFERIWGGNTVYTLGTYYSCLLIFNICRLLKPLGE